MYKILLIDDEQDICDMVSAILTKQGYSVRIAIGGKEGVYQVIEFQPDLIFCDVNMPGMDGFETISMLRQKQLIGHSAFIFLSGSDLQENFRKGMNLGADDFLSKPFTASDILQAVEMRMQRQQEIKQTTKDLLTTYSDSKYLSHELNTPLNGIIGGSQLLLDYGNDFTVQETQEMLSDIYAAGQQLKVMIGKTLMHESLLNGKTVFADKQKVVSDIISTISEQVAANASRPDDLEILIAFKECLANKDALTICVQELVENAFKFSKAGQKVTVKADEINGHYNISVSDAGNGMTDEQIGKIGPYQQFDRKKQEQQGMGLGLAIVQRINKLLKLDMIFASNQKTGTRITLSF